MVAKIILLAIMCFDLGVELARQGKPRTGYYSFWERLFGDAILLVLYYYAGLFDNFSL